MDDRLSKTGNLFEQIPAKLPDELIETLHESSGARIERIVSQGHASSENFWYDQPNGEWVVVLRGRGKLRFERDDRVIDMQPGDYIYIPPRERHRVEWTTPDEPTVWLAVHVSD